MKKLLTVIQLNHAVHKNTITGIVCRRRAGHHVQGGFGHIGMRIVYRFVLAVELPLHCRHINDETWLPSALFSN